MARKLRLEFPGACYHVTNRGSLPKGIFAIEESAEAFEQTLFETCEAFRWKLHGFVIMRDHFHLALELSEPNLSVGMQWLQGTWANRFNRTHGKTGRPFRGRFKGVHVDPDHFLAQVVHFIHLNPVRNKLAAPDAVADFRWSSLWWFTQRKRPAFLDGSVALADAGQLKNTAAGWKRYLGFLADLAAEDPKQTGSRFAGLRRGWILGSPKFRQKLLKEMEKKGGTGNSAKRQKLQRATWEKGLRLLADAARIDLTALPSKKSASEKVLLAAAIKRGTGVKNAWIAERLGMGTPASASHFVRQFLLESESNKNRVNRLVTKLNAATAD